MLPPPPPPESELELDVAAASDVVVGVSLAPAAPVANPKVLVLCEKVVEKPSAVFVDVGESSPKVKVLEIELVVTCTLLVVVGLVTIYGSVAMRVPLIKESSNVDVAVTVTVRSPEVVSEAVVVPLVGGMVVCDVVNDEVIVDVSPTGGVVTGDVMVPWDESVALPVTTVPFEIPGMVTETAVVIDPTSVKETTAPVVATGTSVTFDVDVPSFTFTSTTLAVTVASGARGRR